MHQFTNYYRKSLAAKLKIDFRKEKFFITDLETIESGKLTMNENKKWIQKTEQDIIIAAKTIKTNYMDQTKKNTQVDEMTGVFYIPAVINKEGYLKIPNNNKLPWIPREYLFPLIDDELAIGSMKEIDEYISNNFQRLEQNKSWTTYFEFAKDMFKAVTKAELTDTNIHNMEFESNIYVIKDKSIDANKGIIALYDDILKEDINNLKLYQSFIYRGFQDEFPLVENDQLAMKKHVAQMNNQYSLSPSQRECVNHFNEMEEGEILAVNGPPGTGKTALLQSLIATLYVEKALQKEKAPFIVATSTNNQAVTNIIESFITSADKNDALYASNLTKRWIEGVNSFGVYFPSKLKEREARSKGIHYTNPKGEAFFKEIESDINISLSKEKLLKECSLFFHQTFRDIESCKQAIHSRLTKINRIQKELITLIHQIDPYIKKHKTIDFYLDWIQREIDKGKSTFEKNKNRLLEWENHFKNTPFIQKYFSFIPAIKKKRNMRIYGFLTIDEDFPHEKITEEYIIKIYGDRMEKLRSQYQSKQAEYAKVKKIEQEIAEYIDKLGQLNILDSKNTFDSLNHFNESLDTTLRYHVFWLAVHYYECEWLEAKRLTERQIGKNFKNVLEQIYGNLSMITPCFVMTFFQLSQLLKAYDVATNKNFYLYNAIDLLIIDEAGQVSPEIAVGSFALAKRAVVVGDVYQIEPVWNINESLDMSLAFTTEVIQSKEEFETLKELGLNTSSSSVMKIACKCSKYVKNNVRGLFLSEHRRCYNEIIDYCNKLVYKGMLEPKRGFGSEDPEYALYKLGIPHLGYLQIDSDQSQTASGSRYNTKEAEEVVKWIRLNFDKIMRSYVENNNSADDDNEFLGELIGVVTPFRRQANEIKRRLPKEIKDLVDVGTVHTFQGGERRLIILSTVYGGKEGCHFVDSKNSLLNVAIPRAKDSFLVFGDINCLSPETDKPSGLLRKLILNNPIIS